LKLHFTSNNESILEELAAALKSNHQISSSPDPLDDSCDGLVIGTETESDHREIVRAKELGITVYSVPDLIYHLSEDKQRIVITGSTGKKAVVSWLVRMLKIIGKDFDFVLSTKVEGFEGLLKISDAPVIILEGSEKRSSALDTKPQFLRYNHHIALITDISHEFEELYPSFDGYVREFDRLADATPKGGTLIYNEEDDLVTVIGGKEREDVKSIPYSSHPGTINEGTAILESDNGPLEVAVSNIRELQYLGGAFALLKRLSITNDQLNHAIKSLN